ncbi:hypothetical protein WJX84_002557 [Apatococcus fuscideae]|uniref:Diacylglycerol kinase n=1 Tax=Apatococcus fuscideae TaxID=2026836 RepID=A0AAW1S4E7_9CHLO
MSASRDLPASDKRPAEVDAPPSSKHEYWSLRQINDLRQPYRIPATYLQGTKPFIHPDQPEAPLIVFINSRSGGRAGATLTETLYQTLGHSQVFDLAEHRPGPVLTKIWQNLQHQIARGDVAAEHVRSNLKILAAGGDGTVAWVLQTIHALDLRPHPAVAVMPLGTGNDLALSFGWGNAFQQAWIAERSSLYATLKRVAQADAHDLDRWGISISCMQPVFHELPHSLGKATADVAGEHKVAGLFWNYLSVGLDAQSAYGFHSIRESKPWLTPSRLANQAWYSYFSCATGWFCGAPPIATKASLKVRGTDGIWKEIHLTKNVKALVLLNLQSYGGGRDLWGVSKARTKNPQRRWQAPIFDDGLIEVVGLRSGWQMALVMGGNLLGNHGRRLAQAREVMLDLHAPDATDSREGVAFMQVDGEPWKQQLPSGSQGSMQVHIQPKGHSLMLFNDTKLSGISPKIQKVAARAAATDDAVVFGKSHSAGSTAASAPGVISRVALQTPVSAEAAGPWLCRSIADPGELAPQPSVQIQDGSGRSSPPALAQHVHDHDNRLAPGKPELPISNSTQPAAVAGTTG